MALKTSRAMLGKWPAPAGRLSTAPNDRLHASHPAAKQAAFCVDKPKASFKPVFEVATTREGSEVVLVRDPEGLCPLSLGQDQDLVRVSDDNRAAAPKTDSTRIRARMRPNS